MLNHDACELFANIHFQLLHDQNIYFELKQHYLNKRINKNILAYMLSVIFRKNYV